MNILSGSDEGYRSPEKNREILERRLRGILGSPRVQTGMLPTGVMAVVSFMLATVDSGRTLTVDVTVKKDGTFILRFPEGTPWGKVPEDLKVSLGPIFTATAQAAYLQYHRDLLVKTAEDDFFKSGGAVIVGKRITIRKGHIQYDYKDMSPEEEALVREVLLRRGLLEA